VVDVVTGKLDVRAAASHLPAEDAEPATGPESKEAAIEAEFEPEKLSAEE